MFGVYRRRLHRNQRCKTPEPQCTYNGHYRDSTDFRVYARSPYRLENSVKITDILMSESKKTAGNTMRHGEFRACQPGPSSSSTSTSSTSEKHDSMRDDSTPCPANTRSRTKRSRALGDQLLDSKGTQNKNKNEDTGRARGSPLRDLP